MIACLEPLIGIHQAMHLLAQWQKSYKSNFPCHLIGISIKQGYNVSGKTHL